MGVWQGTGMGDREGRELEDVQVGGDGEQGLGTGKGAQDRGGDRGCAEDLGTGWDLGTGAVNGVWGQDKGWGQGLWAGFGDRTVAVHSIWGQGLWADLGTGQE